MSLKISKKNIRSICVFISGALLAAAALVYTQYLYRQKSQEGTIVLQGLQGQVRVFKDEWGVPHIFADNNEDLFYALGFVTADERLYQMELNRRLGAGTLSELFGEKTLKYDKLFRSLQFRKTFQGKVNAIKAAMPEEMRVMMDAYFKGVNQFMKQGRLPLEYLALGIPLKEFELLDALAFSGYLSFSFAQSFKFEPLMTHLLASKKISIEMLNEIRRKVDDVALNDFWQDFQSVKSLMPIAPPSGTSSFEGSNSFVLAGSRTNSKAPILGNDPHMKLALPTVWFEAHLKSPDLDLYGHFMPLVPFPVLGHTRSHGWGLTMALIDEMDFYYEKLSEDKNFIVFEDGRRAKISKKKETLKVRGGKDQVFEYWNAGRGPIMRGESWDFSQKDQELALSLKWTFYHPKNKLFQAFYHLMRADEVPLFKQAVELIGSPSLNITYANNEGDIAWWLAGFIPQRPDNFPYADLILDGTTSDYDYQGHYTIDENPHSINPKSGFIVSANQRPMIGGAGPVSGYYDPGFRYKRLQSLLEKSSQWTLDQLKTVQTDYSSSSAEQVIRNLLSLADKELLVDYSNLTIFKQLVDFNGEYDSGSWQALLIETVVENLMVKVYGRFLDDSELKILCSLPFAYDHITSLLQRPSSKWWAEAPSKLVTEVLEQSIAQLKENYGADYTKWSWGDGHFLKLEHSLGKNPFLSYLVNSASAAMSGGPNLVNNLKYDRCVGDLQVTRGPSTRRLIDFASPELSYGINPGGNSGRIGNKHYLDQFPLYINNLYRYQYMDMKDLEGIFLVHSPDQLLLLPSTSSP